MNGKKMQKEQAKMKCKKSKRKYDAKKNK